MSHQIHSTTAIIMKMLPEGEESVVLECLTEQLGRIYMHVQGARKLDNKHRMYIFPLAHVIIDCVEGKHYFRCTGISEREQVYSRINNLSFSRRKLIVQASGMIGRLVPAAIPIPEIFGAFETFYHRALDRVHDDQDIYISYLVLQLRILGLLGYWNSEWSDDVLHMEGKTFKYVSENVRSVEKLIARILEETQMTEKVINS
jgi:recombinational DNA repair protein (RecF pathway)